MKKLIIPNEILLGEASDMLARGIEVIIMTKGNSMLPFIIGERDSVLLKKLDTLKVGDIVLARISKGHYVLHRVFELDGDAVTLMGDGNLKGKETCTRQDVMGTVMEIITPKGKHRRVTSGKVWRLLLPLRRIILAVYRRLIRFYQ